MFVEFRTGRQRLCKHLPQSEKVPPGKPFLQRLSEQVSRMKHHERGERLPYMNILITKSLSAQLRNALSHTQECTCGNPTDENKQFWLQKFDLPFEERLANRDLGGRRRPVARRTPEYRIGDVEVASIETDAGHHGVEQLATLTDERLALAILFGTGCFANQHQ